MRLGGLLVANTWVYGDMMDLEIRSRRSEAGGQETVRVLVAVYCRPQKTYLLLASTNFLDWLPVATNTPTGSRFGYLVPAVVPPGSLLPRRHGRNARRQSGPVPEHHQPDGTLVTNYVTHAGRVVIVGEEPLLKALRSTNGNVQLLLYALPATTNVIESVITLANGGFGFVGSLTLPNPVMATNLADLLPPLSATNRTLFLRAVRP